VFASVNAELKLAAGAAIPPGIEFAEKIAPKENQSIPQRFGWFSEDRNDTKGPQALATANSRCANQAGMRLYNERLLLSLARRFGQLSKVEVQDLSAHSTSAILKINPSRASCPPRR
jgi:hypothetical protein